MLTLRIVGHMDLRPQVFTADDTSTGPAASLLFYQTCDHAADVQAVPPARDT